MKTLVTYGSHYGFAERYARQLAQQLNAELCSYSKATQEQLQGCDVLVHLGGVYVGSVAGMGLLRKHAAVLTGKRLAVCAVGIGTVSQDATRQLHTENQKKLAEGQEATFFHLRGGIDYSKMSLLHRMMMGMMRKMLAKKPQAERAEDDIVIIERRNADFIDFATLAPVVEWVQQP